MKTKIAGLFLVVGLVLAAVMPVSAGYWNREEVSTYCVIRYAPSGAPIYGNVVWDCLPSSGRSCLLSTRFCLLLER